MRTPNLHRAKIAQQRVRMEGWRQRRPGSKTRNPQEGRRKTDLTLTGLLMEGVIAIYGERVVTPAMDVLNESGSSAGRGLIPSGDSPFFPALGTARKIQFAFFPRES